MTSRHLCRASNTACSSIVGADVGGMLTVTARGSSARVDEQHVVRSNMMRLIAAKMPFVVQVFAAQLIETMVAAVSANMQMSPRTSMCRSFSVCSQGDGRYRTSRLLASAAKQSNRIATSAAELKIDKTR